MTVGVEHVSISVPADVLAAVRGQVGPRGLSAFLTRAAERELRRVGLSAWLDETDVQYGSVPPEVAAEADQVWSQSSR